MDPILVCKPSTYVLYVASVDDMTECHMAGGELEIIVNNHYNYKISLCLQSKLTSRRRDEIYTIKTG